LQPGVHPGAVIGQKDGSAWVVSDNGFGSKANSPDAMLVLHQLKPDWASGQINVQRMLFLQDPGGVAPFNIANSATTKR